VNFIIALTRNQPITLIDSDISTSEIDLDLNLINSQTELISSIPFNSIDDLINAFIGSTSQITIFTSGTTGQPKKVVHSLSTLGRDIRTGDKYKNQIWGFAYNPTHMAGIQVFLQAFANKNKIINIFNTPRLEVYKLINEYQITHISATPTFYRLLKPFENSYQSVIRITFGGEKSNENLHEEIRRIFPNAKVNNIYASTEAGSIFWSKGENFLIPPSINDLVKIKNDEILLHKSLLGVSDTLELNNNFYHTGDIVEWIDEENGIFKFKNRKNELINVGGYKVNPHEVESEISKIKGVEHVIVYGKSNSVLGNILCAEIVSSDAKLNELKIRQFLSDKLQDFKIPRRIIFTDKIELTRTGKTKRI
jgi:acyl-coenzyme A synthetase/AMP-(fatty) acid ligase